MENIKIFATSEALEFLKIRENAEIAKTILQSAMSQINRQMDRTQDCYSAISQLGVAAIWATKQGQESVMLLYQKDCPAWNYVAYPEEFWADVSKSTPVDLV